MRVRRHAPPGRLLLHIAGIASLVMLATANPAFAADDQARGWYAALDLALAQPNSLDQHYADVTDFSSGTPRSERLVLENDADSTFRLSVGYRFGKGLGSLQVSYWTFDNDDRQEGAVAGYVVPAIFGSGYYGTYYGGYYGAYLANPAVTATSSVKATTMDVDYQRPMAAGEKTTINWLMGLRLATYEEDQGFVGNDGGGDYIQTKHIESDAAGFRFGASARFAFTKSFSLQGGVAMSFLQADTEGTASQTFPGGAIETRHAEDDYIRGTIWDFDLRALWTFGALDYYVGYTASSWEGMVADPVPANTAADSFPTFLPFPSPARDRESIGFNGWQAGVVWRFGKG
jgi:hypothetical protein